MPFRSNGEPAIDDWALLRTVQANALLIGPPTAIAESLSELKGILRPPVHTWAPATRVPLPDGACGTLIVQNVGALDSAQQVALLEWLNGRREPVQVLSTSDAHIWPLVEHGAFEQSLYYRLNVMYVDLTPARSDR